MPTRWSLPGSFRLAVFVAMLAILGGCSQQGEGDRCDPLSGGNPAGTADCQSGLICSHTASGNVCCPANGPGNAAACTTSSQPGGMGNTLPATGDEGGVGEASAEDAGGPDATASAADAADGSAAVADGGGAEAAAQ